MATELHHFQQLHIQIKMMILFIILIAQIMLLGMLPVDTNYAFGGYLAEVFH
jgi:hypothetical protein